MAAHRMPESDRPRRPVPAWVTAPPVDEVAPERVAAAGHVNASGREARPTPASSRAAHAAPVPPTTVTPAGNAAAERAPAAHAPAAHAPTSEPASIAALVEADAPVPDFPPQQEMLPPAPTSPNVHTVPFETPAVPPPSVVPASGLVVPVSPVAAAPASADATPLVAALTTPSPEASPAPPTAAPAVPVAGQPRFSVPGLEHVVVEGTEPEPVGPIGYRTPRRFAHQQAAARSAAPAPAPAAARSFDAVLHAAPAAAAPGSTAVATPDALATTALGAPAPVPQVAGGGEAGLPTELLDQPVAAAALPEPRRALGATAGAVLGAVAGIATIGLAAWWFTAPATVHGVGVVLGLLALVLSIVTLRDRTATWQRPVALLGAVLGGVGTVVLLWAVAAALLPLAGVTLPDVTGTGTTPTLAP
ncbi:hypothetical protein NYQ35_01640 [Curtobacterium flaccumfaciens pv. flaccumfaciens]|uniref:hypothetical protein n=1 Tax=Curtobacterium flaccumfaciens TaxID=2035 RepID=UPI00217F02D2|nr:hypothetical protein [Curtobacterium flaccumfaciens]MCS6567493.1 hypothetical protein [Curtobacterium flaccumfaciens pv. flaccumfaciens]MCS6585575.1 hypothetical protein [Curtobacterium flaccumfaciens pv. flaccumfaciens]